MASKYSRAPPTPPTPSSVASWGDIPSSALPTPDGSDGNEYLQVRHASSPADRRPGATLAWRSAGAPLSHSRESSEGFVIAPRNRSAHQSFSKSSEQAPWASRDSAFSAPPSRDGTLYTTSVHRAPLKAAPMKSTALKREADGTILLEKPWTTKADPYINLSRWVTYGTMSLGLIASALYLYFGYRSHPKMPPLCLVLDDNFESLDTATWTREIDLGGFGNGEFSMTTDSEHNSYVQNGRLYLTPLLTEDLIGREAVLDGHTFNLTGCTNRIKDEGGNEIDNPDACGAVSNATTATIIPPVMSARLHTKFSHSITYGKVSVTARLPKGDWLWPAIWMLPVGNAYGPWPLSGEIDIMESRGNGRDYPKQGRDYVRSSLNWGPTSTLNAVWRTFGWFFERRTTYDKDFHEFTLEWTDSWMYIYVDSRLHKILDVRFKQSFFDRGEFPQIVRNGTEDIILKNPWENRGNSAPFDQEFYLILNVAVGGTNGWFPDGAGNKPWNDGSKTAASDFYAKVDEWYPTWGGTEERSMVIDSVKMWKQC